MARPLAERFERLVDPSGDHHVWLASKNPTRGTGQMRVAGKMTTAHRVAWELAHGPLQAGQRVTACPDEPSCVRLDHLSVTGTTTPASRRRARKGSGSIREIRPDVWELNVTAKPGTDGRPRRVFRTVHGTRSEASRHLAFLVAETRADPPTPLPTTPGAQLGHLIGE